MSLRSYNNMSKEFIHVGSKMYSFPRMHYETDHSYFMRRDFFTRVSPLTEKEYVNTLNMSIVWVNMKLLKCTYAPEVMEHMNKLLTPSVKN